MTVIKKAVPAQACCLGEGSAMEQALLDGGRLRRLHDGGWEVFTQESGGRNGQLAQSGDYVKLDSQGFPYPNRRAFFLAKHTRLPDGRYLQKREPLTAWQAGEPLNEPMRFLLERDLLRIDTADPARYFACEQWGAELTAASDAVVLFYKVERDAGGAVADVSFNFVTREVFDATYEILDGGR